MVRQVYGVVQYLWDGDRCQLMLARKRKCEKAAYLDRHFQKHNHIRLSLLLDSIHPLLRFLTPNYSDLQSASSLSLCRLLQTLQCT